MRIFMSLFCRREEGTYYRAFPWARGLAARGHQVTLACTTREARTVRSRVHEESGVRLIETPSLWDGRWVMTRLSGLYGWSPFSIAARTREIRWGGFDVVHAFEHQLHVSLPVVLAGRRSIPALISDQCDHYGKGGFREQLYSPYRLAALYRVIGWPVRTMMDEVERRLKRSADAVTVISRFFKERAVAMGITLEKIHVIPGSADVQAIRPMPRTEARRARGLPENANIMAFLGAGQFDVEFSLEAFVQVLRQKPNCLYLVLGPKDKDVAQRAKELGVADKVIQTGWIQDEELPGWLACADVCLIALRDHPVNQGRWPNKIGSYMAAGRPTVCTEVGDVAVLVRDRNIGRVAKVDPGDFAGKILELLQHPELAQSMGARARTVAENEFALEIQVKELESVYLNCLEECHAGAVRPTH
ncbi:MAG: glycosyltransferase family 4 protein [Lentisphaerota bacterium]